VTAVRLRGVASRRTIINQAARRYGISPSILYGVWGAESNFGRNRGSSSAGARGDFQFMPGTARSLGVRIGDFRSEAFGAAKYLSQYRSRGRAGMLAAYNAGPAGNPHNPETQAYIPKVLAYARTYKGGGGAVRPAAPRPATGWTGGQSLLQLAGSSVGNVPQGSEGILPLLQALGAQKPQVPSSGSLTPPAASAAPVMPQGAQTPLSGGGPAPKPDVNALLAMIRTTGGDVAHADVPGVSALIGSAARPAGGGGAAGRVPRGGGGVVTFDGKPVVSSIARELRRARATGLWKGTVTSGVRTKSQQMAAARRFGLQHYGPKGPLGSNHVAGHSGAVDVTDPAGLARALRHLRSRLHRGMADDPVHFSWTGH
jgi:hypothetical protein